MSTLIASVPRKLVNTSASAEVIDPCAAGYSGWFGVAINGRHPACSVVRELPSSKPGIGPKPSPVGFTEVGSIAATGRQNR